MHHVNLNTGSPCTGKPALWSLGEIRLRKTFLKAELHVSGNVICFYDVLVDILEEYFVVAAEKEDFGHFLNMWSVSWNIKGQMIFG